MYNVYVIIYNTHNSECVILIILYYNIDNNNTPTNNNYCTGLLQASL